MVVRTTLLSEVSQSGAKASALALARLRLQSAPVSESSVLIKVDSAVIQLAVQNDLVVISSLTRCTVMDLSKTPPRTVPVGSWLWTCVPVCMFVCTCMNNVLL